MKYINALSGLMPSAPSCKSAKCPICGGLLDGIVWVKYSSGSYEQRCTTCCKLVTFTKKGKIDPKRYLELKEKYESFKERKNNKIRILSHKLDRVILRLHRSGLFYFILQKRKDEDRERELRKELIYVDNIEF